MSGDERSLYITVDDEGDFQLNRVFKILGGLGHGEAQKAIGSALARTAQAGKTVGAKLVTQTYALNQETVKKYTRNINHTIQYNGGGAEVSFGFRGNVIPLIHFDTAVGKDGIVKSRVIRTNVRKRLDSVFSSTVGKHTGLFERMTPKRFPIKEIFGPSAVQLFYANEKVLDEMNGKMAETYEKRIEHEITRILNGWRN
jgi:hypothetical protein